MYHQFACSMTLITLGVGVGGIVISVIGKGVGLYACVPVFNSGAETEFFLKDNIYVKVR